MPWIRPKNIGAKDNCPPFVAQVPQTGQHEATRRQLLTNGRRHPDQQDQQPQIRVLQNLPQPSHFYRAILGSGGYSLLTNSGKDMTDG